MPHNALTIMGAMRRFPKGDRRLRLFSLPLVAPAGAKHFPAQDLFRHFKSSHFFLNDCEGVKGATAGSACFHCPLVASADAKYHATKQTTCRSGDCEGFQRATAKPFGRSRRSEILAAQDLFRQLKSFHSFLNDCEGVKWATAKPPCRSRRSEIPTAQDLFRQFKSFHSFLND